MDLDLAIPGECSGVPAEPEKIHRVEEHRVVQRSSVGGSRLNMLNPPPPGGGPHDVSKDNAPIVTATARGEGAQMARAGRIVERHLDLSNPPGAELL